MLYLNWQIPNTLIFPITMNKYGKAYYPFKGEAKTY